MQSLYNSDNDLLARSQLTELTEGLVARQWHSICAAIELLCKICILCAARPTNSVEQRRMEAVVTRALIRPGTFNLRPAA